MRFVLPTLALIAIAACGSQEENNVAVTTVPPVTVATLGYADVKPIFDAKCVGCHGESEPKDGLSLNTYAAVIKGGENGSVIVAGDPASSKLVKLIDGTESPRMPFKQDPLSQEEIDKISKWIEQGAKE